MVARSEAGAESPMIVDAPELEEAVRGLAGVSEIAFDCEGDGYFRYRARLCVVQLADRRSIILVDTLETGVQALAPLLGDAGPVKVVHDAAYDARLLRDHGAALGNVFDTSVAGRFLGEPALGLKALLQKYLEVDVPKEHQLADWGARPLEQGQRSYLENDVRHLLALADRLRVELEENELVEEVALECRYVLEQAAQGEGTPRPAWARIKGHDALGPESLAVLRSLAIARETVAEARDVPPFRVAPNDVLVSLARRPPRSLREVRRHRGVRGAELAQTLYEASEAGRRAGAIPPEERSNRSGDVPSRVQREADQRLKKRFTAWRRAEAERRGVPAQAVLPGHCMTDLIARKPLARDGLLSIPGFGSFRVDRYGDAILALLGSE